MITSPFYSEIFLQIHYCPYTSDSACTSVLSSDLIASRLSTLLITSAGIKLPHWGKNTEMCTRRCARSTNRLIADSLQWPMWYSTLKHRFLLMFSNTNVFYRIFQSGEIFERGNSAWNNYKYKVFELNKTMLFIDHHLISCTDRTRIIK